MLRINSFRFKISHAKDRSMWKYTNKIHYIEVWIQKSLAFRDKILVIIRNIVIEYANEKCHQLNVTLSALSLSSALNILFCYFFVTFCKIWGRLLQHIEWRFKYSTHEGIIKEEMLCVVQHYTSTVHNPSTSVGNMEVVDRLENI